MICWKCKGVSKDELSKLNHGKFFTADMQDCKICEKMFTSSDLFSDDITMKEIQQLLKNKK